MPPIRGKRGRPRRRPGVLYADRGYDHDIYRRQVRDLGIRPLIARPGTEHGSGLGKNRWVVEAAFALLGPSPAKVDTCSRRYAASVMVADACS